MKKFLSLSTLLLMVLTISAQTKIAPKMKKGMKKVYVTECTIKALSEDPVKVSFETKYEVTDATSDGYVLDLLICDVKSDAKSNNLESRMYSLATEVLKDIHTTYATDKDGKVTKLLNMEEVKKQASKALEKLIAKLGGSDSIPEGTSVESIKSDWNEEAMLESVQLSTSPLVLNGKTISNGSEVPAKLGLDPCQQFQRIKRFCHIIVCPDGKTCDFIHILHPRRQHNNRVGIAFPNFRA